MTTLLDIIDTAVKIGLGALISGATTFLVTRKSHSHERATDFILYKRNTLLEISQLIDDASKLRNDAMLARNNMIKTNDFENEENISKVADAYWQSAGQIRSAITKCYLINELDLAELSKQCFDVMQNLYMLTIAGRLNEQSEYRSLCDHCDQLKRQILEQYSTALEKIYA